MKIKQIKQIHQGSIMNISAEFKKATINLSILLNKNYENTYKTFIELSDNEKQDIGYKFMQQNVYNNCNELVNFLSKSDDFLSSNYIDDLYSITNKIDRETSVDNYLIDLDFDILFNILQKYDIEVDINTILSCVDDIEYIKKVMNDKKINDIYDLIMLIQNVSTEYSTYTITQLIVDQISNETLMYDLDIDEVYEDVYEFYFVSDYFTKLIDNCANDILGQAIWGRTCTGQSICLDHDIQVAAFKIFSDLDYNCY